jgi:hypothetical protein
MALRLYGQLGEKKDRSWLSRYRADSSYQSVALSVVDVNIDAPQIGRNKQYSATRDIRTLT